MDAQSGLPSGRINGGGAAGMTKAEIFEDEKQRIIDSCFGKKDSDGSLQESYITHIRILEDAAYPFSPPPPGSNQNGKKARLIIVAVRKSGRVRMHKARENNNGTFSIGKTWMLDELTCVESFNGAVPTNADEEQRKQWAGGVGFIMTIGKPYYWQAHTQKEKEFFIASLWKIYTKYTGGKQPALIGFDARERDALIKSTVVPSGQQPRSAQPQTPRSPSSRGSNDASIATRQQPGRDSGNSRRQQSRDLNVRGDSQSRPILSPSLTSTSQSSRYGARSAQDDNSLNGVEPNAVTPQPASAGLRDMSGMNRSQDFFTRSDDPGGMPPRSRGGMNGLPKSVTPTSQRTTTPDRERPSTREGEDDIPHVPAPLSFLPDRRRPPIAPLPEVPSVARNRNINSENLIPAPLASPARRDEFKLPERSLQRAMSRDGSKSSSFTTGLPDAQPVDSGTNGTRNEAPVERKDETIPPSANEEPDPNAAFTPTSSIVDSLTSPMEPPDIPQDDRSGLTMLKKKSKGDIAIQFRKAARAANAFKPRAGGAAERLLQQNEKGVAGPDGITGVVPAPSLLRNLSNESSRPITPALDSKEADSSMDQKAISPPVPTVETTPARTQSPVPEQSSVNRTSASSHGIPEVKITLPQSDRPSSIEGPVKAEAPPAPTSVPKAKVKEPRNPNQLTDEMIKSLAMIGIDPDVLGGRCNDFVALLDEHGWTGDGIHTVTYEDLHDNIERQLNLAQSGGWLAFVESEDERVEAVKKGLDHAIAECDELDGLLTLYGVELGTLTEDIAYIEAQSQGLQVQAANQKLLQAELQSLLQTISISPEQLQSLRESPLESANGLEMIEESLVMLYKAMTTIDPSIGLYSSRSGTQNGDSTSKSAGIGNSEIGSMQVLQEKKQIYNDESLAFLRRLKPFLQVKFAAAIDETRKALEREKEGGVTRRANKVKLDTRNHDLARNELWKYSPIMLFAREVDQPGWDELMRTYEMVAKLLFQEEFRDAVFSLKRNARKPTGDEGDILFTAQLEKQAESLTTAARKLTVKRSHTLAKTLRSPGGDGSGRGSLGKTQDGRLNPFEVFGSAVEEMVPIMFTEQNFIVEFFHASSLEQSDFVDMVSAAPPGERFGGDLKRSKIMDPNRDLAKRVVQSMEELFPFFSNDMQSLVDWCIQADPLQGVGALAIIERKLQDFEESSQEYLARTFQKLHLRLAGLFNKFLDEQIRAIEETKVKIKKRKGVIAFVRIFPIFATALETMLSTAEGLEVRDTVNTAYGRIFKSMFESLKVIARENPIVAQSGGVAMGDPEDKEALNYQILLIENMNHYVEEVDARSNAVLAEWKEKAGREMDEHLALYLGAVVRRPLGKLLDFVESVESLLAAVAAGSSASAAGIAERPSHSKSTFKKVLSGYDAKEIRRGIDTLRKRVEKHFGDADDPGLSRGLVAKVLANCEKYYEDVEDRVLTVSRDVYDGEVELEWTRSDVNTAFRK